jgi:hypothetical protein
MNGKNFPTRILFSVLSVRSSFILDEKTKKFFMLKDFFLSNFINFP